MPACFKSWSKSIVSILLIQLFYFNAIGQIESLLPEMNQSGGLQSNAVRCVMVDVQGRVWTGTDNGLNILNANSPIQKNIIAAVGNKSIWGINFLDNLVFIGSRFDGLYIFNQQTGKLVEQYPSTTITLIRKIKVFDKRVFVLSNNGVFEWASKKLTKLNFTENIIDDFPTDIFYWQHHFYALVYGNLSWSIVKLQHNAFEENCTKAFIGKKHEALLCAQSKGNKLVIGGDKFYIVKEAGGESEIFSLPKQAKENYAVWDIAICKDKIILALGENNSSRKGLLYVHGNPLIINDEDAYGYITSLAWDERGDNLYFGDLNRGLFLQKSITGISAINKTKHSTILANGKHSVLFNDHSITNYSFYNSKHSPNDLPGNIAEKNALAAILSGDTLVVATNRFIKLYNANSFQFIKSIPIKIFGSGIMSMELMGNNLYLFHTYSNGVFKINLSDKTTTVQYNVESFLPSTQNTNDRIIFLNKEKGFNIIEKDTAYKLLCSDKSIPFTEDFTVIQDHLYAMIKNNVKVFRIDYQSHQLIRTNSFDIDSTIEGFTAKWLLSKNNKLYLLNDKGALEMNNANGLPLNYYYFGNYNQIDKPVIAGDSLLIATSAMLTKIAFSDIDKKLIETNLKDLGLFYPETLNENLGFTIDITYPDYLVQNHGLKYITITKNGKLISKKYSLTNQFHLTDGLNYGKYTIELSLGNSKLGKQINISLPLNRNPYFFGVIIFSVIVTLSLLVKSRLDKKEFNKKLMQNRLQVLKQNLNPHFVFNSMNLISSLILEEKYDKAVEVVAEFSNLQRTYLETNNKETITLTEELKFLDSYLKLQQTRFHHDKEFSYQINISPHIDNNTIILPPLILQPLAENAIKYGVIASHAINKKIWVDVNGKNPLVISIEDNGLEVDSNNKSLGLGQQLVKERISLFMHDQKIPIRILFDKSPVHSTTGYRVEVHIG